MPRWVHSATRANSLPRCRKLQCAAALILFLIFVPLDAAENVKSWGDNGQGQLGNGVSGGYDWEDVPGPVSNLTGLIAVSAGEKHSLALRNDGTVWSWGSDAFGQLGNGASGSTRVPMQVTGISGVSRISAGTSHSLALKNDGTVWAWGSNQYGQLGNGSAVATSTVPVKVSVLTGVTAIAAGGSHNLALKADGSVWAWGYNAGGQVGDGTLTMRRSPVKVAQLTGVRAIAAGGGHSLALKTDGTVRAWGYNGDGQLGDGQEEWYSRTPVVVKDVKNAVTIAAGKRHSLAAASDGTFYAWGANYEQQLGIGHAQQVVDWPWHVTSLSGIAAIAAGTSQSLAVRSDGTVWAWGTNSYGQLGIADIGISPSPVQSGLGNTVAIAAGAHHGLAVERDGTARSWGWNADGQLGNGRSPIGLEPLNVHGVGDVSTVAAGGSCSLALKTDGSVWAWGYYGVWNDFPDGSYTFSKHVCNGINGNSRVPVAASGLTDIAQIAAGAYHRLALKKDGTVWAWGENNVGQLGNGSNVTSDVPVAVSSLSDVIAITSGSSHSMALKSDGSIWAWGANGDGQLGIGSNGFEDFRNLPVQVTAIAGAVAIAAGGGFSLALTSDGNVWVWGSSGGNEPSHVIGLSEIVAIAAGSGHSLALKGDGTVWAWGSNEYGQFGNGQTSSAYTSVPVATVNLTGVVAIAAGYAHSFALKNDGTVRAWGSNYQGRLGTGGGAISSVPMAVSDLENVVSIAAGEAHSLASIADGHPTALVEPTTFNFGELNIGTAGGIRTFTITNTGGSSLEVHKVALTGVNASDFTKTADTCTGAIIAPNTGCSLAARFTPSDVGNRTAAVLILSNAPGNHQRIWLSGTGATPPAVDVKVLTPNGGEKLSSGIPYNIQWTASSARTITGFEVQFSKDGGATFSAVPGCASLPGSARSCLWAAPGPATSTARILVIGSDSDGNIGLDESDAGFRIVASVTPTITVIAPNTAVNWALGSEQQITWNHTLGAGTFVSVDLSRDAGATWNAIATDIANNGSLLWTVTGAVTTKARIRVKWNANAAVQDISNVNFTIAAPFVRVAKPNGGEQWKKGKAYPITWISNLGSHEFVKLELSTNGGTTWLKLAEAAQATSLATLVDSTPSDGSQSVILPAVTSTKCRIRIRWLDNAAVTDISNANFTIGP